MTANLTGDALKSTPIQGFEGDDKQTGFDEHHENIGEVQRLLSAIAGTVFIVSGLSRRNWSGVGLALVGGGLYFRAITGYCPALGVMGIDMHNEHPRGRSNDTSRLGRRKVHTARATKLQKEIQINLPPNKLYRFWRSLANLPTIMSHLESVQTIDARVSHWVMKTVPGGPKLEWDAEIINEIENQRIGWRTLPGADVKHAGSVEFKPTGDGRRTWLTVRLQYEPPRGKVDSTMVKWFGGDPGSKLAEDLRRFKAQMEMGVMSRAEAAAE